MPSRPSAELRREGAVQSALDATDGHEKEHWGDHAFHVIVPCAPAKMFRLTRIIHDHTVVSTRTYHRICTSACICTYLYHNNTK